MRVLRIPVVLVLNGVLFGCGDSAFRSTQLPNGYVHTSNGGYSGDIIKRSRPEDPLNGTVILPRHDEHCDRFGWSGDYVVGIVGKRQKRLIDPVPESERRYVILDTRTGKTVSFEMMQELQDQWESGGYPAFPEIRREFPSTRYHW